MECPTRHSSASSLVTLLLVVALICSIVSGTAATAGDAAAEANSGQVHKGGDGVAHPGSYNKRQQGGGDSLAHTQWSHVFIAANFFNNEDVVEQFTKSLKTFVQEYLLKHMSPLHIYISVFANGSNDETPKVIEESLVPMLLELGKGQVAFHVVSNGTTCGQHSIDLEQARAANTKWAAAATAPMGAGDHHQKSGSSSGRKLESLSDDDQNGEVESHLEDKHHPKRKSSAAAQSTGKKHSKKTGAATANHHRRPSSADHHGHDEFEAGSYGSKPKAMDRIKWMACVRNAALQPLFEKGTHVFLPTDPAVSKPHQVLLDTDGVVTSYADKGHSLNNKRDGAEEQADGGADEEKAADNYAQFHPPVSADNIAVVFFNDIYFNPQDIVSLLRTKKGNFDMTCGLDQYYSFYDTWVTRDADGRRFFAYPPYGSTPESQDIFRQFSSPTANHQMPLEVKDKQAAVGVRCCWNGVAAMRGGLFVDDKVRFRFPRVSNKTRLKYASKEDIAAGAAKGSFDDEGGADDCYSSECTLLCEDIGSARRRRYDAEMSQYLTRRRSEHPLESTEQVAVAALAHMQREGLDGPPRIFINPMVSVAYEVPFYELHHKNWLITSGIAFTVISWVNVFSWPVWYSPLSAEDQYRIDGGNLDCVKPEDVVTYTLDDLLILAVVVAVVWHALKRQGVIDKRRRFFFLGAIGHSSSSSVSGSRFFQKQK